MLQILMSYTPYTSYDWNNKNENGTSPITFVDDTDETTCCLGRHDTKDL